MSSVTPRPGRTVAQDSPCDARPRRGDRDSARTPEETLGEPVCAQGTLPPPCLRRMQQEHSARFQAAHMGGLAGPRVLITPLATAGCSFMCPVGIFFIISPLDLINPHSVMNLEISIKHTVANQHGTSGAAASCGRAGSRLSRPGLGLGAGSPANGLCSRPGPSALLRTSGVAWVGVLVVATPGVTLGCPSCRAGRSALPVPPVVAWWLQGGQA